MKKIVKLFCAVTAVCCAAALVSCSAEVIQEPTKTTETTTESTTETVENENKVLDGVKFEGYECSGYYVCLDSENIVDQNGIHFSVNANNAHEGADSYSLYAETENGKTLIFNTDYYGGVSYYSPHIYAYIDDSLYFCFEGNLYRIELQTDETGAIVSSDIYLVKEGGYFSPVKVQTNTLILKIGNSYFAFDTKSGETEKIEYNTIIESSKNDMPVSADEAINIAFEAIKDENNYEDESFGLSVTNDDFSEYELEDGYPQLVHDPDLIHQYVIHEYYPEYAWRVKLRGNYIADVYINAESGEVSAVSFDFLD